MVRVPFLKTVQFSGTLFPKKLYHFIDCMLGSLVIGKWSLFSFFLSLETKCVLCVLLLNSEYFDVCNILKRKIFAKP